MATTIYMFQQVLKGEPVAILPHSPQGDFSLQLKWRLHIGTEPKETFETPELAAQAAADNFGLPSDVADWIKTPLVTLEWG